MSPLGRTLLELCDEYLVVNLDKIRQYYPERSYISLMEYAGKLGLRGKC